jgi:hypothetical protein
MALARATGSARRCDSSSLSKSTRRSTKPGCRNPYGKASRPPSAPATTKPRLDPPVRGTRPPCRRNKSHRNKFSTVDTTNEKVIQGLNLLSTKRTVVPITQAKTSESIGSQTVIMQDKPTKETHPIQRLSLPKLRGSQVRRPTEEKRSVSRG